MALWTAGDNLEALDWLSTSDSQASDYLSTTYAHVINRPPCDTWGLAGGTLQGMTTPKGPTWLTVKDVAEELSASPMTVYRIINSGELKSLRMGARSIRVKREHLEEYLENQTAVAAALEEEQDAKDREVEQFLFEPVPTLPSPGTLPGVKPLAAALEARGYGVPEQVLTEALVAALRGGPQ